MSVKTLRYYDEVGLLKPVEVDRFTGYRYYDFDQLPRLYRILALKDPAMLVSPGGLVLLLRLVETRQTSNAHRPTSTTSGSRWASSPVRLVVARLMCKVDTHSMPRLT